MDIQHLDAGELVEYGTRGEARGQGLELGSQGNVQVIGHEGDKDVRLDAALELVVSHGVPQALLRGPVPPAHRSCRGPTTSVPFVAQHQKYIFHLVTSRRERDRSFPVAI